MHQAKKRVIIVGAGIAGISAAIHIANNREEAIVVESKPYWGGRARSFTEKNTNEVIDNGQHLCMGCYTSFLSVLSTLGTNALMHEQQSLRVPFYSHQGWSDVLDGSLLPGKNGVALGILRMKHLSWKAKLQAVTLSLAIQFGIAKPQGLDCKQFLERYNQPADIISNLWEPLVLATLNAPLHLASAELLVEVIQQALFGKGNSSHLLTPTVGLSQLLEPFPRWLTNNGGTLHTSTEATELVIEDGKATGIVTSDGQIILGDAVLIATPPKATSRLLPTTTDWHQAQQQLQQYSFSPIVSLYLWTDVAIMDEPLCALLGTTTQWVFNKRIALSNATHAGLVALTISAGAELVHKDTESIARHCFAELQQVFPKAKTATLVEWKVIKEKSATFLATPQMESQRVHTRTHIPNLFFAGDWTNTHLPATLEGAARSGEEAARNAISVCS